MINLINQLITALQDIEEEETTICTAIVRIENELQALKSHSNPHNDRQRAQIKLWETVLHLMQKPEQAEHEESEINFEQAAHDATYINPDDYLLGVDDPLAETGPEWDGEIL